jgi:hypothetical protein
MGPFSKLLPAVFFIIFSVLFVKPVFADPPVVSANGFTCAKSQMLVTCQGQFPATPGLISAAGTLGVQISYDTMDARRLRFLFDSTTGCLMQISVNAAGQPIQALVKNAAGRAQVFPLPAQQNQAFGFCKS